MARVRTVRGHQNLYGDKPNKAAGDEYDLPDNLVGSLVGAGLIEAADASAEASVVPPPASAKTKAKKGK